MNTTITTMGQAVRKSWLWITTNIIGLFTYLYYSSSSWPKYETNLGLVITGNDAFMWGVFAFPILVVMFLMNMLWLFLVVRRKKRPSFFVWLWVAIIWACVLSVEIFICRQARAF